MVFQIHGGKWLALGGWPPSSNFYHLKMYLHLVLPNVSCLISEFCVVNKGEYRPKMAELIWQFYDAIALFLGMGYALHIAKLGCH